MWFTLMRWRRTAEAALQLAAAAVTERVDLAPTSKSVEKKSHCCCIRAKEWRSCEPGVNTLSYAKRMLFFHLNISQCLMFSHRTIHFAIHFHSFLAAVDFSELSRCKQAASHSGCTTETSYLSPEEKKKAKQLLSHPRQTDRMTAVALSQRSPGSCCSVF